MYPEVLYLAASAATITVSLCRLLAVRAYYTTVREIVAAHGVDAVLLIEAIRPTRTIAPRAHDTR